MSTANGKKKKSHLLVRQGRAEAMYTTPAVDRSLYKGIEVLVNLGLAVTAV